MYDNLITKMMNHFSSIGSIIYSKACDYEGLYPITENDINMYYELLNSTTQVKYPQELSKKNHILCCLYYLTKQDKKYKDIVLEKFIKPLENDIEKNDENLVFMFNIIEYDIIYLNSPLKNLLYLYSVLKIFANFETSTQNVLLYKYYRCYVKYKSNDMVEANKEYFEIIVNSTDEIANQTFYIKFIRLKNSLLRCKMLNFNEKMNKSDYAEGCQFLKDLYEEEQKKNKAFALKVGLNLFSVYLLGKKFDKCIPLLNQMKKMLKKELLKGTTMKNGIHYYLAIASRLGFMGILLEDQKAKTSALKKIRKTLKLVNNKDEKMNNIIKAYSFIEGIIDISLNHKINFDLKSLAYEFQKLIKSPDNYIINEQNHENIIINLKVANNMNLEIEAKEALNRNVKLLLERKDNYNYRFLTFIAGCHDKIYGYSQSYNTDKSDKRKEYIKKICDYAKGTVNIVYKYIDDEPLLKTPYVQNLIVEILFVYAHIFLSQKSIEGVKVIYNNLDDLIQKINISKDTHTYGLISEIKGHFWFLKKDYKASVCFYEDALRLLHENHPKIPIILFNCGVSHFLYNKNREACREKLNRCINEFNTNPFFSNEPNREEMIKKISLAKQLLNKL